VHQLEVQLLQNGLQEGRPPNTVAEATSFTFVLHSWAASCCTARPFSSSSDSSGSGGSSGGSSGSSSGESSNCQAGHTQQQAAVSSEAVTGRAKELVQRLQQGVPVVDCIVQQVQDITRQQVSCSAPCTCVCVCVCVCMCGATAMWAGALSLPRIIGRQYEPLAKWVVVCRQVLVIAVLLTSGACVKPCWVLFAAVCVLDAALLCTSPTSIGGGS
jgi:hypothetical protein